MIVWQKAESNERPLTVEAMPDGAVRVRKNITQIVREEAVLFSYDEAVMTLAEYTDFVTTKQRADIDYMAAMCEVDLDE